MQILWRNIKKILLLLSFIYTICFILVNSQNQLFNYFFNEKIWIHRVNSVDKLSELRKKGFDNVELDIEYIENKNIFDVNHLPAKSIGLTLNEYFASHKIESNNHFWLDFKNLSDDNKLKAIVRLSLLCKKYSISKKQLIIESTNPACLLSFKQLGFITSYYITTDLKEKEKIDEYLTVVANEIESNQVNYISTFKRNIPILLKRFKQKQYLTWSMNYHQTTIKNPYYLIKSIGYMIDNYRVLNNPEVKIILFKYISKKGNR